jgi:hypothetical protein
MAACPHICREDAEDVVSQAFLYLYQRQGRATHLALWIWKAKCDARWHYTSRYLKNINKGLMSDLEPYAEYALPDNMEVFHIGSLLVRKDARSCLNLWLAGYNRAEIAKYLNRTRQSVTTLTSRLRKKAKKHLENDIKIYHNKLKSI